MFGGSLLEDPVDDGRATKNRKYCREDRSYRQSDFLFIRQGGDFSLYKIIVHHDDDDYDDDDDVLLVPMVVVVIVVVVRQCCIVLHNNNNTNTNTNANSINDQTNK